MLFNLNICNVPDTECIQFWYADDLILAFQSKEFKEGETVLSKDLEKINQFFKTWNLTLSWSKTEVTSFHLNNNEANRTLKVMQEGSLLKHNPRHLGVDFDRTLSFNTHLSRMSQKIKSRLNILQRIVGSNWGVDPNTIRTAALGLVYSTAEYC